MIFYKNYDIKHLVCPLLREALTKALNTKEHNFALFSVPIKTKNRMVLFM